MPVEPVLTTEAAGEDRGRRWRNAALAVGLSGPVAGAMLFFKLPPAIPVVLHFAAAFAAYRLWRRPGPGGPDLGLVAATIAGCFPVVGSLGAWWVYGRPVNRQSHLVEEYKTYIGKNWDVDTDVTPLADPRQALGRELAVLPLGDQLTGADLAGKQGAASALMRLDGASGVKILRDALVHPAADTRLMASLALLKKEEALVAELKAARAHAEDEPVAEAYLALAQVAKRYADSGLCAPLAAQQLWGECAGAARQATEFGPDAAAFALLATACLAIDEPHDALDAAQRAIALQPMEVGAHQLRLRALFALGRFDQLSAHASTLAGLAEPGSEAADQAAFWSGHAR